jgi:transcriptional antiterminator RfaH
MKDSRKWYALYTRPRFENKAYESLIQLGFEAYLPKYKTIRQWSDRKKKMELPLIPSYCFVKIRPQEYYKPMEAYGVVKHIWFDNAPAPLKDTDILAMRMICEANYDFELVTTDFKPGTPIMVKQGPFKGVEGEVIEFSGKQQVLIKIESINHGFLLKISPNFIESAASELK